MRPSQNTSTTHCLITVEKGQLIFTVIIKEQLAVAGSTA